MQDNPIPCIFRVYSQRRAQPAASEMHQRSLPSELRDMQWIQPARQHVESEAVCVLCRSEPLIVKVKDGSLWHYRVALVAE